MEYIIEVGNAFFIYWSDKPFAFITLSKEKIKH